MRGIASLGSFGVILLASPAFAEEVQKGMPQLDFANPLTIAQVVWLAIIFFALYVLLSRWALPKVAEVLEARAGTIAGDLDAARNAKAEADASMTEMRAATHKAQAAAQAQVTQAVDAAKADAAAQAVEANARLEGQLAAAEARIAEARVAAIGALREVATTTTVDLVHRLAGFAPAHGIVDNAVDRALTARAA